MGNRTFSMAREGSITQTHSVLSISVAIRAETKVAALCIIFCCLLLRSHVICVSSFHNIRSIDQKRPLHRHPIDPPFKEIRKLVESGQNSAYHTLYSYILCVNVSNSCISILNNGSVLTASNSLLHTSQTSL